MQIERSVASKGSSAPKVSFRSPVAVVRLRQLERQPRHPCGRRRTLSAAVLDLGIATVDPAHARCRLSRRCEGSYVSGGLGEGIGGYCETRACLCWVCHGVRALWEVGKGRGGVLTCCERRFDVSRRVGK